MLLEKAIAKVCGCYEDIPEEVPALLEMIFCGPVAKQTIRQLKITDKLSPLLKECTREKELTVLISKKDSKIRNHGLNEA